LHALRAGAKLEPDFMQSLAALYFLHVQTGADPCEARDGFEEELACFLAAACDPWPALPLDASIFVPHVAGRSIEGRLPPATHAADLYLACACAHGIAGALDAFEERYASAITRAVSRKNGSPSFVDEARQRLRERLFVSSRGLPKIAQYRGRTALAAWVTLAASREALMLLRGETRRRETTGGGDAIALEGSPELALLKRRYVPHFAAAVQNAFAKLSDRERTLLELHIVGGVGIDRLGELYKVGRSTAARWLAAARETLVDQTRRELKHTLRLSDSEYGSLAELVRSQLDISVVKLLRDT
jgi:RNA polymerase sigma-70 factor (ECF subfamily)